MNDLFNKSSSGNNNNDRKKNLLNKLLNKLSPSEQLQLQALFNKSYVIRPISIRKPYFLDYVHLQEISSREDDGNLSFTFCRAMREFVGRHSIPNPQARLDRILKLGLPHKPSHLCCVPKCRKHAKYILTLRDYKKNEETFQVCPEHKKWTHHKFKYIIRMKKMN